MRRVHPRRSIGLPSWAGGGHQPHASHTSSARRVSDGLYVATGRARRGRCQMQAALPDVAKPLPRTAWPVFRVNTRHRKAASCRHFQCARVDSNHHGEISPQGPQPRTGRTDASERLRIVQFAGFRGQIGRIWRRECCQDVAMGRRRSAWQTWARRSAPEQVTRRWRVPSNRRACSVHLRSWGIRGRAGSADTELRFLAPRAALRRTEHSREQRAADATIVLGGIHSTNVDVCSGSRPRRRVSAKRRISPPRSAPRLNDRTVSWPAIRVRVYGIARRAELRETSERCGWLS